MKIFYYTYPWAFDSPGGGERQLLAYKNHLENSGINFELYDMWTSRLEEGDIFHCFSIGHGVIDLCGYAKRKGLKLIVNSNLWITEDTKNDYPYDYIWNILYLADIVIVNSNMEGDNLSRVLSMPREKFVTVYNGVEDEFIHSFDSGLFRHKYGLYRPYVLNIANIEPRKNQLKFLEAMKAYPDMDFVVVGNIRDAEYAQKCTDLSKGQLKIIGPVEYNSDMLRSMITGCELFAMPSMLETPSISALEAAASGTHILLTEVGSTYEYFGDTVTYVNPESITSMIEGIAKALEKNTEASCWVVQDRFMWRNTVKPLVQCYYDILEGKQ